MAKHPAFMDDIADNRRDKDRLQPDETTIDLPDVKDIPGQEHIVVPHFNGLNDTTISSSDEEGDDLFGDETEENDSDVTNDEKEFLQRTSESMSTDEDEDVYNAELDNTDDDGEILNENIDVTGEDLDVPGTEDDDEDEETGEEDEENNEYSLGGDNHDLK